MSPAAPRSQFTPSLMAAEVLERLFVARGRLLDSVMERVKATAISDGRNHTLLVGPRGSGKTHLVSLVHHRTRMLIDQGARLQLAWLPEDPWTILTYPKLLEAIVSRLEPKVEGELPRDAAALEALVIRLADDLGPIVVIVENLDEILRNLGDDGQQRLRHLLQAERSILLIATSTQLDRNLADQARPFYGFFTTTRLGPFSVEEATDMLVAIAKEHDDDRLVAYLREGQGQARLRAINHLAGGQPRMWSALASSLTVEGLDELLDLLLTRFDDLTPYYQERLHRLAPQQRLAVAELAEADRPISVVELASLLEVDQRSLSKTMSELAELGWAAPVDSLATALLDKRRTYYELAEPLARLSFQIKDTRGKPLGVVIDFLKHWFDPTQLAGRAENETAQTDVSAPLLAMVDDALAALGRTDAERYVRLPSPVRAALDHRLADSSIHDVRKVVHRAALHTDISDHAQVLTWQRRAEDLVAGATDGAATERLLLACWQLRAGDPGGARATEQAVDDAQDRSIAVLEVRADLANAFGRTGRVHDAIDRSQTLLDDQARILGPDHPNTLITRNNLAHWRAAAPHRP